MVISPLIALMKDQVYNLKKRGISAAAIYSGMRTSDIDRILDNAVYGGLKLLYLSPERLGSELVQARISRMNVSLLAVDEAHCISQWGYDFRPSYLEVAAIRPLIGPDTPVLALTATAAAEVVIDIQEKLAFRIKNVFRKSFERANLAYVVSATEDKIGKTADILKKVPGCGIVYVRNRRISREIAQELNRQGISADYYHAGLSTAERSKKQEDWMLGKTRVIVSTNAFGMGIDKPDVRIVVHIEPPDNLEAYFQEAGRAGRDERKSYAVLLYHPSDKSTLEQQYESSFPALKTVRQVYRALGSYYQLGIGTTDRQSHDFDLSQFCKIYRFENQLQVLSCLKILEQAGWLNVSEAVFIPSAVALLVNRSELYDFQLKNRSLDTTIKALIRAYPQVFGQPVFINEMAMAHFMKIGEEELLQKLKFLHQNGIIDYSPRKEKPQICFTRDRVNADDLSFDHRMYAFRKDRQRFRMEKVIEYCETQKCRSSMLLAYFGQENSKDCGVCDYCLSNPESRLSEADFERYREKIKVMLSRETMDLDAVVGSFSMQRQSKVLKVLEYLIEEGFIQKDGDKLSYNKK